MINVAIISAMTVSVLGPSTDVLTFFNSVVYLLEGGDRGSKFPGVTDRLYCRSIDLNEISEVRGELSNLNLIFSGISVEDVDLSNFGFVESGTWLLLSGSTLSDVFSKLFIKFHEALECAEIFYKEFKDYSPVRIGFSDAPFYISDINRPSADYDALSLDDLPFWLRCPPGSDLPGQ
ncbi:hypothetical protein XACN24_11180 [Xanthomonas albilineans]|uniref:Imm70 family immunity protein n=1 Tax=Xanthomonas albilineans TaxID=29447 RepID=UPI0009BBF196|nr:Imm70 family immunity protein [Xanthomonas albilineans]